MADFPPDFGSNVGLALVGLHPDIALWNFNFTKVERDLFHTYPTLYPQLSFGNTNSRYSMLLTEFLTDPGRAGEHALDGPKCALVAKFLLDCFILPCSEYNFVR